MSRLLKSRHRGEDTGQREKEQARGLRAKLVQAWTVHSTPSDEASVSMCLHVSTMSTRSEQSLPTCRLDNRTNSIANLSLRDSGCRRSTNSEEELEAKAHEKEESATRVESPIKSREHCWRIERGKKGVRFEGSEVHACKAAVVMNATLEAS